MTRIITALALILLFGPAQAHEHWINHGGFRSPKGEHCCNEKDCSPMQAKDVEDRGQSFYLHPTGETIPRKDAHPSRDGRYWRCEYPDGTTRCFFYLPGAV